MDAPIAPLILFDDDHYMYVLKDRASAEAWWEMPDEYGCGFDALARPLRMTGEPLRVSVELTGEGPAEGELRRLVAGHYERFLNGRTPPDATGLAEFVAELPVECQ
ncbi:hypothetical protein GCM10010329_18340 [Streptomyces spiroverticillatus]|uniref:Uncharacterized protein n=1 Tax=Streptomyces finlayi TaxID=67296 RepID=A0A918WUF6_9ACTN|nr:hypothetical protein [Streptomyces finlayi]GGZ97378.1 hypothetical protein GCM10010329_18340 [Streptomyces spiroverticillatus]GHC82522.1 hypothetical protein GCM10010334_10820 [Streptomyces finlayi]